jgi:hypothetical protein
MKYTLSALAFALAFTPLVSLSATPPPSPAALAAVKAMHAHEMMPGQNGAASGMKDEQCRVYQAWAKCSYSDSGENSNTIVVMKQTSGTWKWVGEYGGVAQPSDLEKMGVPSAIATKFADPSYE